MSKHELFVNSINNKFGETYIGKSYYSSYFDENCICVSAPLTRRREGGIMGIIINAYALESLNEITANREIIFLNSLRYSPDAALELTISIDDPAAEPMKRALSGNYGLIMAPDYRNVTVLAAYQFIPEIGWGLVAKMDKAEAFAPLKRLGIVALILGSVCGAATIVMGIVFSLSTAGPINRLKSATERIAKGNLKHKVDITRKDEIGALASSFNNMTRKLANEIAEHKRTENELAANNKELEAFCYSVSHDLRAPLRGIDGFSGALEEDFAHELNSQGKDYVRRIRTASQRMGQLIDDLLDLSRITRSEMKHEEVDLSAMAQKIASELQELQPERQIEFIIAEGLCVNGDTNLLQVAMDNLLNNAWKFTGKHSHAKIEFGILQNDSRHVYFVSDDGAGFDMAYVHKLFGAFQRLHSLAEFEGTGIGLATVQRIIHRHGGRIWAEGEVEHGATFYFTL